MRHRSRELGTQGNQSSFSLFSAPLLGGVQEGDCNLRTEKGVRENSIQGRKLSHNGRSLEGTENLYREHVNVKDTFIF